MTESILFEMKSIHAQLSPTLLRKNLHILGKYLGFQLRKDLLWNFPAHWSVGIIGLKLVTGWAAPLC